MLIPGNTTGYRPPAALCAADHKTLSSDTRSVLSLPNCPLIQSTLPEIAHEDVRQNSVKSFAEVKVDNIHTFLSSAHLVSPS